MLFWWLIKFLNAKTKVYSSPIALPLLETIDNLSPSGSVANPISAPTSKTLFSKSF
jgi:hypothetical protein